MIIFYIYVMKKKVKNETLMKSDRRKKAQRVN